MAGRRPIPNELLFSFEPDEALFDALRDLGVPKTKATKLLKAYGRPEALSQASERALRQTGGLTAPQAKRVHAAFRVAALCDETCERRVREGTKILDPALAADFLAEGLELGTLLVGQLQLFLHFHIAHVVEHGANTAAATATALTSSALPCSSFAVLAGLCPGRQADGGHGRGRDGKSGRTGNACGGGLRSAVGEQVDVGEVE